MTATITTRFALSGIIHSEAGNAAAKPNEDAARLTRTTGVVADGATGLGLSPWNNPGTAAAWFAQGLAERLPDQLADPDRPLPVALGNTLASLREDYFRLADPDLAAGPSAAVAGMRLAHDHVELFWLGDTTTLVQLVDGTVRVLHDDTVTRLDDETCRLMAETARRLGIPTPATRPYLRDRFVWQRSLRNTPGGYWVADLAGAGAPHACTATFPADQVRRVAILSDGMACANNWWHEPAEVLDMLADDPAHVARCIRAGYDTDPNFEKWPRTKQVDDMTVLLANL